MDPSCWKAAAKCALAACIAGALAVRPEPSHAHHWKTGHMRQEGRTGAGRLWETMDLIVCARSGHTLLTPSSDLHQLNSWHMSKETYCDIRGLWRGIPFLLQTLLLSPPKDTVHGLSAWLYQQRGKRTGLKVRSFDVHAIVRLYWPISSLNLRTLF